MAKYYRSILTDSDIASLVEFGADAELLAIYIVAFDEPDDLLYFRITNGPDLRQVAIDAVNEHLKKRADLSNVAIFLSIPNLREQVEEIWIPQALKHQNDRVLEWLERQRDII